MSEPSHDTAAHEIVERILSEAAAQAHALLETAQSEAQKERLQAEEDARELYDSLIENAQIDAAKQTARTIASAKVEAGRLVLQAREDAINALFKRIEDRVRDIPNDIAEYRIALTNLLTEAITAIGTEVVSVYLSATDRDLANEIMLEQVKRRVHENTHRTVTVSLHYTDHTYVPGCIATSEDGHVRLDNTLERRLVEARRRLRPQIVDRMEKSLG